MSAVALRFGFGRLWTSSLLSNLSDGFRAAAFPLVAATLTRDPMLVAGVTVAQEVPWVVAGPLAGVVVDRVDRGRLMWAVNTVRALVFGVVVMAVVFDLPSLWLLYLTAFALGVGESLYDNAAQSAVPALVDPEDLERANGRIVAAQVIGNEFVGPPLGALLFGLAVVLPFGASAFSLLIAALLVMGLVGKLRPVDPSALGQGIWRQVREGFRFVARDRKLSTITLLAGLLSAADAAWFAVLVLYVIEVLGTSEAGFGVILAIGAVGGITGAMLANRLTQRMPDGVVLAGSLVLSAATQFLLWTTSDTVFAVTLIAVSSLSFGIWNVVAVSMRQRLSPSRLLGRVNATYNTVAVGAAPIGAILGGVAAAQWGIRAPFLIGVPALIAGAVLAAIRLR